MSPRSVRLSLTDRCDLACVYCRPADGDRYLDDRLEDHAWSALLDGLEKAGIKRVRITGGEPLLDRNVTARVRDIAARGFEDIALTTNGTRLASLASKLREAGLKRITISIDSLDADRFRRLTRGGNLAKVLAGIDAAVAAGFDEVKLNTVVLCGENDHELEDIVRFAWARGITPRFIEVMRIGEGAKLASDVLFSGDAMRARLAHLVVDEQAIVDHDRGPAKYLKSRVGNDRVGFITGTTNTYCEGCDRLRVAADGMVRACLATDDGVSAALEARGGDGAAVADRIVDAWAKKPDGRTFKGCTEESAASVSMRGVGG